MHKLRQFTCAFLLGCALVQTVFASVSVRVFSKDEGLHETNIAKPRFYIQNVGDESISGFYCYYYFTVEQNQVPILDDYYTPDAATRLENLNNGNYRVRFDFSGALNPGEAKPNLSGKVVGLHYSNWSAWDKANDFSSIGTEIFTLNSNIPIFTSSGVLIYGNTPSDTSIPPQPPKVSMNNALGEFAVYSSENSDIRDRAEIRGGHVGSAIYTEAGCDAVLGVGVYSGRNIFLRERAVINGDAVAGDSIKKQNNVQILGTQRNHAQLDFPVLGTKSVTFGTRDTSIGNGASFVLTPGDYRDFQVFSNSVIRIMPGKYSFRKFLIEPDVQVVLNVSDGETIEFDIGEEIRFADRTLMSFESGTEFPLSFRVYSAQTSQLFIGNDAQIFGLFTAPLSEIHVYSRTNLNGALYGNRVIVEPESKICKPPVLTWLTHSKIVMAPEFNNLTFNYTAMVPDVTATLLVTPSALSSVSITVNGNLPDTPVNLTSIENTISILLNSPEACGTTEYELNVKRSSEYMIYVNDNSPCDSGAENGNSWSTAFKNLQQAIDTALVRGKEIWVAEGEYKPSRVTNESDPRSASFMIKPGIVLKGGFDGTETTDEPKGSVYNTILSGDLGGNDDSIGSWPPSIEDSLYTNDNAYHVVTIDGHKGSEIMMTNLIVQGGVANGGGENSVGAGIFSKNLYPTLEMCGIQYNIADSCGAGIYTEKGVKSVINCLFKKNVVNKGSGGGLFVNSTDSLKINASVFDGNITNDTSLECGGGAIFVSGAIVDIVNSVFTRNNVKGRGGAIFNDESALKLTNCTFYNNTALKGFGGINNQSANDTVINTILWDDGNEIADTNTIVLYSCVNGGYDGEGNISENPKFVNVSKPEGEDEVYGTIDDGLRLTSNSLCIDVALESLSPLTPLIDIVEIARPTGTGIEIGAYEYVDLNKINKMFFGRLREGVFTECYDMDRILQMVHHKEIYQYSKSKYHRVIRGYVEKNGYTSKKDKIKAYITPVDSVDNILADEIEVELKKIGEENGLLVFQSMTPEYEGKKIIFTGDPLWHGYANPWAYVVYVNDNMPRVLYRVPRGQFK